MIIDKISHNKTLDDYILNFEFSNLANISSNAYRFWKNVRAVKYDESRVVYLEKKTIPKKYQKYIVDCTDLSGYVQAQSFCRYTTLSPSHLTKSNNSKIIPSQININYLYAKSFFRQIIQSIYVKSVLKNDYCLIINCLRMLKIPFCPIT